MLPTNCKRVEPTLLSNLAAPRLSQTKEYSLVNPRVHGSLQALRQLTFSSDKHMASRAKPEVLWSASNVVGECGGGRSGENAR